MRDRPLQAFNIVEDDGSRVETSDNLIIEPEKVNTDAWTIAFLRALVLYVQPKVIAEAGTYKGYFPLSIAKAAKEWGGTILTYDVVDHGANFDDHPNVVFGLYDFGHIEQLGVPIDFAFIDSGPPTILEPREHELRLRHYNIAKRMLTPGGIIAVHDTNSTDWTGRDEIVAEASMVFTHGEGLSLWQKPS